MGINWHDNSFGAALCVLLYGPSPMAKNLLPIRILFQATLALAYLPTIGFSIYFIGLPGLIELTALAGFGILAALCVI